MPAVLRRRSTPDVLDVDFVVREQRPRTLVRPVVLLMLRPFFRYSGSRDAYVLRLVGRKAGPVLRTQPRRGRTRRASAITP